MYTKKLYYYPISHILGVVMRVLTCTFLLKVTGFISLSLGFFHFMLGCVMAVFTAFTIGLVFYFSCKIIKCRTSKHTLFTLILLLYCIGNNMFLYISYAVFDKEETTQSTGYGESNDYRTLEVASGVEK